MPHWEQQLLNPLFMMGRIEILSAPCSRARTVRAAKPLSVMIHTPEATENLFPLLTLSKSEASLALGRREVRECNGRF